MSELWTLVPVIIFTAIGLLIFVDEYSKMLKEQGEKNARIRKSESELDIQTRRQLDVQQITNCSAVVGVHLDISSCDCSCRNCYRGNDIMSDDIVTRLRERLMGDGFANPEETSEAADEIERLRAVILELQDTIDGDGFVIDNQRAIIERLGGKQ